ncbi:MAG: bifunctional homocysteine S-methyltransferase/methylenetetrahydrofolate reductase [Kiritimatiellaeota bacterium]|nr:bifunctional homocysteine S-methyltransferase/methylenetetrahydrofolate reductase [Kiritimatiellota bacterium]
MTNELNVSNKDKENDVSRLGLKERINSEVLIFDGAMGTEIYKRDYFVNTSFDELNIKAPDVIGEIHAAYIDAGSDVLTTNTFTANRVTLSKFGLGDKVFEINTAAAEIARDQSNGDTLIAGSVGPLTAAAGVNLDEEECRDVLAEQISALRGGGVDFIVFETLPSLRDVETALAAAAKSCDDFPYVLSFSVDRNGESHRGEPLRNLVGLLSDVETAPTAVGLNCCVGPEGILNPLTTLLSATNLPVIVQPNAGIPKQVDGRMIYMASPEYLTTYALRFVNLGASAVGGCCGTGPEHIADMARSIKRVAVIGKRTVVTKPVDSTTLKEPVPTAEKSSLGAKLAAGEWISTIEIVPPKGFDLASTIEKAAKCAAAGIDAINIPDGPRASSRISPLVTAIKIESEAKIEAVLHFCCRDRNLIGMQSDLLGCAASNIKNLLFVTGDPPKLGQYPNASAVFDADSIGMVEVQRQLNKGIDLGGNPIGDPTSALIGVGADPNAIDMIRELRRTREKIEAGAEFIITQPVFDIEPLLRFIDEIADLQIPVLAGIWPLASYRNAEFMKNEVPGVVVPDSVMERMGKADTKEAQRSEGIAIAREAVEGLRDVIKGVQVSAPFGNVDTALAVTAG